MSQRKLTEAEAWRECAKQLDADRRDIELWRVIEPQSRGRIGMWQRFLDHLQGDGFPSTRQSRILFCLMLALECEDEPHA